MNGVVVDASVTAAWLLDDEFEEAALRLFDQMRQGRPIVVPSLWVLEITNALFSAERRKRIDRKQRQDAQLQVERMPVRIVDPPNLSDLKIISHYIERHRLTAYDAEYLRVAREYELTLASFDAELLAAARKENVPVIDRAR